MSPGFGAGAVATVLAAGRTDRRPEEGAPVLSQDEQARLEAIAAHIRAEDYAFAEALGRGVPQSPRGDRRWPFQLLLAVGVLLVVLGLNDAVLSLIGIGAAVVAFGWRADRRRRINRQRRPAY
jgi:hypothetical protein